MLVPERTPQYPNQTQTITPVNFQWGVHSRWGRNLFHLASCVPPPQNPGKWPKGFKPLLRNLYKSRDVRLGVYDQGPAVPKHVIGKGGKMKAVVGFSSGKDSACVAAMLQHKGYDVHLLHLQGLNRSYPQELGMAQTLAKVLGMPLTIYQVRIRGKSPEDYDNRLKNQFIMTLQLDFAMKWGMGMIGQGNHAGDHLGNVQPTAWFTDARENYDAFCEAFPGSLNYFTGRLKNVSHVYATLANLRPDTLPFLGSCIHPYRFVTLRRAQTERDYGITPLAGRCGVCYKCCWEYLILSEICSGLYPWKPEYAERCLQRIMDAWELFYVAETKPADRHELVEAIIDQKYTPTPRLLDLLG